MLLLVSSWNGRRTGTIIFAPVRHQSLMAVISVRIEVVTTASDRIVAWGESVWGLRRRSVFQRSLDLSGNRDWKNNCTKGRNVCPV